MSVQVLTDDYANWPINSVAAQNEYRIYKISSENF